jgi:hypothetical protein
MGLRFRKSFKLAPGVRLNVSSGGMSWSLGPRGASVSIGKRGTYFNASLPGTGRSSRTRLDRPAAQPHPRAAPQTVTVSLSLQVGDDGVVRYLDQNGFPVSPDLVTQARRQHGDAIRQLLQRRCAEINDDIAALGQLHWNTPAPRSPAAFAPAPFDAAPPLPPAPVTLGFAERLLPGRRQAADAENALRQNEYEVALAQYDQEKAAHGARNVQARMAYSAAIAGNPDPMQQLLEHRLGEIVWPKETLVNLSVSDDGTALALDVDLPEIEHMPTMRATLGARSWDLSLRDAGATAARKLYQQHVHALGFRMLGEAFAALPTVRTIVLSGYSQRIDSATGHTNEDYLYSVRVERNQWSALNFATLEQIDPGEALASFELRRNMTTTGIFKPVVPLRLKEAVS